MAVRGFLACLVTMAAGPAWAGPFGLQEGMPLSQLSTIFEKEPGIYELTVPQPHPQLPIYSALISPKRGLCKVTATGFPLSDDSRGTRVRDLIEAIAAPITAEYGPSTRQIDLLKPGSVLKTPGDWAMGIAKGERSYARYWKTPSDPEVAAVKLSVNAISSGRATYVELEYEFKRFDACINDMKAAKTPVL